MKRADIATIILVASLVTIISYFVGNYFLGDPNLDTKVITVMDPISVDISEPDREVFNIDAVNPTVEVYIGQCPDGTRWSDMAQDCVDAEGNVVDEGGEDTELDDSGE